MRWVIGQDLIPVFVKAFECDTGNDDPWDMVWCPEVGFSIGYDYTYDDEDEAWRVAKVKSARALQKAQEAHERFLERYVLH